MFESFQDFFLVVSVKSCFSRNIRNKDALSINKIL